MKDWKTTLIGLGVGLGNIALSSIQTGSVPSAKDILISVGVAALGKVASDSRKNNAPDQRGK